MIETHSLSMTSAHHSRLGQQECEKIHAATLEILARVGVDVHDEQARNLLVEGGARCDGTRIRIPEHMVTKALATTPKRITLCDRNGDLAIRAGGYNTYYGGGSDCLNILDHRTGQRRRPVLWDVAEAATLMDALPEMDFVMSAFLPAYVDQRVYDHCQMGDVVPSNGTAQRQRPEGGPSPGRPSQGAAGELPGIAPSPSA